MTDGTEKNYVDSVNNITEEEYKTSVQKSQEKAHDETMWGKPARDIVTGIGNNGGIRPVRAIWELVQNARDVVGENKRAKIVFTRKTDSVVFQHDGIPFTHKTIEALIMQTSSKQATNAVQVGQYGTGFLTTHLFGLSFKLTAPLLTSEEFQRYYKIDGFEIDRSPNDNEEMKNNLKAQWKETQDWGNDLSETTDKPYGHTIFCYESKGEQAKLNAKEAFKAAPDMTPYVMTLNGNVESIEFVDEVEGTRVKFVSETSDSIFVDELADGNLFKHIVKRTTTKDGKECVNDYCVYLIISKDMTEDDNPRSKMIVMLPIVEDADGSMRVIRFIHGLPLIYIHLPLLGTESWGFNFMLHSSLFTCDKDSRDSLRLVGNGQNNDYQADTNRELIALANNLICQFIDKNLATLKDAKYLVKAAFQTEQADKKLSEYYSDLQKFWRDKFESLCIVDCMTGGKRLVSSIKVLDSTLCDACEKDSTLLDAVYGLLARSNSWVVPVKEDMIYWSKTINRWYLYEATNPHSLSITNFASIVPNLTITNADLSWLHKICKHIVEIKQDALLDIYTMIPNEDLKLQRKTPLLHPVIMDVAVKSTLSLMAPDVLALFVHPVFYDVWNFTEYGYTKIKENISNYINQHNSDQNGIRDQIKTYKQHDLLYPQTTKQFEAKNYESKLLDDALVSAMLLVTKMLLPEDSQGKHLQLLSLLVEYYGATLPVEVCRLDKTYDLDYRAFCNSLAYDALLRFTLMDDKSQKADWCLKILSLIHSLDNSSAFLGHYQIYQDQLGNFKYAEWLKKQSQNVPDRAIEIYDTIVKKVTSADQTNSLKHSLVSKVYAAYYDANSVFDGLNECKEIEGELEKKGYVITNDDNKNLYVEIIQKITSGDSDRDDWKRLFTEIDTHKGQIMFSVIESQTKRDSIFTIMKVEDDAKLKTIAELVNSPDFEQILKKSQDLIDQAARDANDKAFKKSLGRYVEEILLNELNLEIGNGVLSIPEPIANEQGGQDLILYLNGEPFFYFEIKSRWTSDRSVLMSTMQHKRSCEKHPNYVLLAADMVGYDKDKVRRHEFPEFEHVKNRIVAIENIGKLNERLKDATSSDDTVVHVAGGYEVLVSQKVIEEESVQFDTFLEDLKKAVKDKLEQR